jgi:hypothetical protein
MTRRNDVNNRIKGHMILSNSVITTDGISLGFDDRMNTNPRKFKRLGIRKIKSGKSENPGYPFLMAIFW